MQKKLTISIDEVVYQQLHTVIGERKISKFIENLVKPYVINDEIKSAYVEMAQDVQSEQEAYDWIEGTLSHDLN